MKTHRIIFEKLKSSGIDDEGVERVEWVEERRAWARVEQRHGSQKWQAGGFSETVTHLFTINYTPGWVPTSSHRLVFKGDVYDIESVENIRFENKEVEIRASKHERVLSR